MTRLLVTSPDGHTKIVASDREARQIARAVLGTSRLSDHPTAEGWCIHPTGDTTYLGPSVRVDRLDS